MYIQECCETSGRSITRIVTTDYNSSEYRRARLVSIDYLIRHINDILAYVKLSRDVRSNASSIERTLKVVIGCD